MIDGFIIIFSSLSILAQYSGIIEVHHRIIENRENCLNKGDDVLGGQLQTA